MTRLRQKRERAIGGYQVGCRLLSNVYPTNMFSIEFNSNPDDIATVFRHLHTRVRRSHIEKTGLNALYWIGYACGIYGVLETIVRLSRLHEFSVSILLAPHVMTGIGFLLIVIWTYARQAAVKRALATQVRHKSVRTSVQASAAEFSVRRPGRATTYQWSAIGEIETIPGFTLFYTGIDSAEFIPDQAFESDESIRRFVQSARQWRSEAIAAQSA